MKKLLISLLVISAFVVSAIYVVGEQTQTEVQKIFAQEPQPGIAIQLISYDKQFFKALVNSQVTLILAGEKPIVINVQSTIYHYPYKAEMNNQIHFADERLEKELATYFGDKNWIRSQQEINLFSQLTGHISISPGDYQKGNEQLSSRALQFDYHFDLKNNSGKIDINWPGGHSQTGDTLLTVTAVKIDADFSILPGVNESTYHVEMDKILIQTKEGKTQLRGIDLQGQNRLIEHSESIDSRNDWKIASYQVSHLKEQTFTGNQLKFDIKGLYAPALARLKIIDSQSPELGKALAELMVHGAQLSLEKLTSKTPWGNVLGGLDIRLVQGAILSEIVNNPFMLLDVVSGNVHLRLPAALLQLPALSPLLMTGLENGLLKKEKQTLSLESQLEQGELLINGRVIPL